MTPEEIDIIRELFMSADIEDPTDHQIETIHAWGLNCIQGGYDQGLQRAADVASFQMEEDELEGFVDSLQNAVFFQGGMVQ